ncbi:hypothetical protein [Roseisolibacter agri]|uniref:Uncharacterized protein n=1 Tax=Roseisolibacter agri TaxID=2014610 RepID=A0AA37V4U9_9BACT|nr:hypothetical protein [Roseisolibacter agri]GLC28392.1 hypothetical protein rosag_49050 [Roseisolibacter agri]
MPSAHRSLLARLAALLLVTACGGEPTPPPAPVARVEGLPALVALLPGDDTTLTVTAYDADGRRVDAPDVAWTMHSDVDVNPLSARFADGEGNGRTARGARQTVRALMAGGAYATLHAPGDTSRRELARVAFAVGRLAGTAAQTTMVYGRTTQLARLRPTVTWQFDPEVQLPRIGALTPEGRYTAPPAPPDTTWTVYPPRSSSQTIVGAPPLRTSVVATHRGVSEWVELRLVPAVWVVRSNGRSVYVPRGGAPDVSLAAAQAVGLMAWAEEPATGRLLSDAPTWVSPDTTLATVDAAGVLHFRRAGGGQLIARFPAYGLETRVPIIYEGP